MRALGALCAIIKGFWAKLWYGAILRRARFNGRILIGGKLVIRGPGKVVLGDRVLVEKRVTLCTFEKDALLEIGDNVYLNGTRFSCAKHISIGKDCILADCRISDTDHHSIELNRRSPEARPLVAPVRIEENVWVCSDAHVLKGVTIGAGSVIGAASVVTKDVPACVIAAGNPARVVKSLLPGPSPGETGAPS